jgi:hypothetical protein
LGTQTSGRWRGGSRSFRDRSAAVVETADSEEAGLFFGLIAMQARVQPR